MVGLFGAVLFDAGTFLVKEMKRGASSEWAEHKILGNIPTLERTGGELSTFSATITFNRRHTLAFETGLLLLESYAKSGANFPLIIGMQMVGGFTAPNYILTKVDASYEVTDNRGRGLHSSVQVEFKQYRVAASTASATGSGLGGLGSALGGVASAVSGIPIVGSTLSSSINSAISAVGGVAGAVAGIPNMIGQIGGKALAAIPAASGGTSSLIPAGIKVS
jgi:hypothetical protein